MKKKLLLKMVALIVLSASDVIGTIVQNPGPGFEEEYKPVFQSIYE